MNNESQKDRKPPQKGGFFFHLNPKIKKLSTMPQNAATPCRCWLCRRFSLFSFQPGSGRFVCFPY